MRHRVVEIVEETTPRGDIGPCAHIQCDERATRILRVHVAGFVVTTWSCDAHAEGLRG